MNLDNIMNVAVQHYIAEESKKLQMEVIATLLSKVFVETVPPNKREEALDNAIAKVKKESYKDSENYDEMFLEVLGNAKGIIMDLSTKGEK